MMERIGRFLATPVGSMLRVFVSAVIVAAFADLADLKEFDFTDWKIYVGAGLTAVLPVIVAYLNPQDPRFGRTA